MKRTAQGIIILPVFLGSHGYWLVVLFSHDSLVLTQQIGRVNENVQI